MLRDFGVPFTLLAYPVGKAPTPPFIIYKIDNVKTLAADNHVQLELIDMEVQLYQREPDVALEDRLYDHLTKTFEFVTRTEAWMESEHARVVYFDFQVSPKLLQ